ncbi:hypothetical protein GQ53DRAFT_823234 [Thozetella sp. PMI_491]|nr:hypothetical protein GQ53DRAFT_823234 [Thozetella sp. PMI_491]
MQMALVSVLAALSLGANALSFNADSTDTTPADPHIADIRTWGELGCDADNQGVWTILQSDTNLCHKFDNPDVVKAVALIDITTGCDFYAFNETGCAGIRRKFTTSSGCGNATLGVDAWQSFEVSCLSGVA